MPNAKSTLDGRTKLSKVLTNTPGALEYIISLNPHDFNRLKNPVMRKYMTPRITLRRVAAMAKVPEYQLLAHLNQLAGNPVAMQNEDVTENIIDNDESAPLSPLTKPTWLSPNLKPHIINVMEIDDAAGDPMPPIATAVRHLQIGEVMLLKHRWEPQPLYDMWSKLGLEWYAERVAHLEWYIYIYRPPHAKVGKISECVLVLLDHLSPAEITPRCTAIYEQLASDERMEITASTKVLLDKAVADIKQRYAGHYEIRNLPRQENGKYAIEIRRY